MVEILNENSFKSTGFGGGTSDIGTPGSKGQSQRVSGIDDTNSQLYACTWAGIPFPIELVNGKGGKRNAIHHKMDRDGAQIEDTGRTPYEFTVRAYFLNGLTPGAEEMWTSPLFPAVWLQVRKALEARGNNIFYHPLYGPITCKSQGWSESFTADVRNGTIVEMSFIEDIDESKEVPVPVSPDVFSQANTLDSIGITTPYVYKTTYSKVVENIIAAPSPLDAIAKITSFIESLYQTIDGLQNIDLPYVDNIYALINSLDLLKSSFKSTQRETAVYIVYMDTTISSISIFTGNSMKDLINLNPEVARSAIIKSGTNIFYYV